MTSHDSGLEHDIEQNIYHIANKYGILINDYCFTRDDEGDYQVYATKVSGVNEDMEPCAPYVDVVLDMGLKNGYHFLTLQYDRSGDLMVEDDYGHFLLAVVNTYLRGK